MAAKTQKKTPARRRATDPYALLSCGGQWVPIASEAQARDRRADAVLWLRTPSTDELESVLITTGPDVSQLVLRPDGVPVPLGDAAPHLVPEPVAAPLNVGHPQAVRAVESLKQETGLGEAEVFEGMMLIAEEGSRRGGGFIRLGKTIVQARRRARLDKVP